MAEGEKPEDDTSSATNGPPAAPARTQQPPASETLPLKSTTHVGYRKGGWGWLCNAAEETDGINVIIVFFTIFTLAVTIALVVQIHYGAFEVTPHGSVTSDSQVCSQLGVSMLKKGGNAVDAAVATAICLGVVHPHVTGLGSGGFMLMYDHKRRRVVDVVDFRETAPASLPVRNPALPPDLSEMVGVPGFLRGLYASHSNHGTLLWKDLIEPSIQLARDGVPITQGMLDAKEQAGLGNEAFGQFLSLLEPGGLLMQIRLSDTLEIIADHGPDALYNGSLSKTLLSTVAANSKMTLDDLANYRVESRRAIVGTVGDYTVMVPGAPSGGPLLLTVLGVLGSPAGNPGFWDADNIPVLKRLAETLRLAALYHAQLGDPDQSPDAVFNATLQMTDPREVPTLRREVEEGGGANWSNWQLPQPAAGSFVGVIDNQDLYVALISGLNSMFGSRLMSPLGFLLNDALHNFTPHSTGVPDGSNAEAPLRRPLSLAVPAIVLETGAPCGQRVILGSSDAGLASQALAHALYGGDLVVSAPIEKPRISVNARNISVETWHSQLLNETVLSQLEGSGYRVLPVRPPYTAVNVIEKIGDVTSAYADSRGEGAAVSY